MKLSTAQHRVIDTLKNHDCYILRSRFYDFQGVVSRNPIIRMDDEGESPCHMFYFKLPTLSVLLDKGLIKESNENEFILT